VALIDYACAEIEAKRSALARSGANSGNKQKSKTESLKLLSEERMQRLHHPCKF